MASPAARAKRGSAAPPESDCLARLATIAPAIEGAAERIDQERRIPDSVIAALHEAGLFRVLLPRELGGAELDPPRFAALVEALARLDASTAWILCQTTVCSTVSASLASEVAEDIFGRDPRAVLAWGPGPKARAVAVEGGYRISGTWSFASGGRHATWLGAYCPILEPDGTPRRGADGAPVTRTMLFPAAKAAMSDIWQVIGLRGTASDAYTVHDLFVPAAYSLVRDDPAARRCQGPLYAFPSNSLFACGFASVALALARGLLDSLASLALEKTPRGYKSALRESAVFQSELAQSEARLRGARHYLTATLGDVWREVEASNRMTVEQRMAIRLAATHVIHEAVQVGDAAYHAAGASAIFARNPFERRFRDLHAVAQQLQGRRSHFEAVGKFLLGVEFDAAFL
jgi:alkylation response protein AidB-like acyl-CoA dehydrogenase